MMCGGSETRARAISERAGRMPPDTSRGLGRLRTLQHGPISTVNGEDLSRWDWSSRHAERECRAQSSQGKMQFFLEDAKPVRVGACRTCFGRSRPRV